MRYFQVIRDTFTDKSTIGSLLLEHFWLCSTLEDVVRPPGVKVPGATAIPEGDYALIIDQSTRFKRLMPHILDVPNFTGIRLHKGNTDADTEGCILVGMHRGTNKIWECQIAFDYMFERLTQYLDVKEEVRIQITHR